MRVMVMIMSSKESEAGQMPSEKVLTEMTTFNEELVKNGIMLGGEGLHPSSRGKKVRFDGQRSTVIDGPFAEAKEVIAGFWIWKVKSMEEALSWVKRIPNPENESYEVEVRPVHESEDFGSELTPETREREERLRKQLEHQAR